MPVQAHSANKFHVLLHESDEQLLWALERVLRSRMPAHWILTATARGGEVFYLLRRYPFDLVITVPPDGDANPSQTLALWQGISKDAAFIVMSDRQSAIDRRVLRSAPPMIELEKPFTLPTFYHAVRRAGTWTGEV